MHNPENDNIVLFSNRMQPPDRAFTGYVFYGADYIYGSQALAEYEQQKSVRITGEEDGCYVLVEAVEQGWEFQTDYGGFATLFYYHDGDDWVVSNSFVQLNNYLREIGKPPRPNYSAITSYNRGFSLKQVTSFRSAAAGVSVMPLHSALRVSRCGATLRPVPSRASRDGHRYSYADALTRHVEEWVGRYQTLIAAPKIHTKIDITGGRDSRTNLALHLFAREGLQAQREDYRDPQFHCHKIAGNPIDLEVAGELAYYYGFELNDRTGAPRRTLSKRAIYDRWKDNCLGSYQPVYLLADGLVPSSVELGGGAAGNHRRTLEAKFREADPEVFIRRTVRQTDSRLFALEFERDLRETFAFFRGRGVPKKELLTEWFLQFRGRFHAGRAAKYRVHFQPFSGAWIDLARQRASENQLINGMINYDIMESLVPGLMDIPYDSETKLPTTEVKELLTPLPVRRASVTGDAWLAGSAVPNAPAPDGGTENVVDYLASDFESAVSDPLVQSLYCEERLAAAREVVDAAKASGRLRHATDAAIVTPLLIAREVSPAYSMSAF